MEYINASGINNESNQPEPENIEVDKCIKYLKYIRENEEYNKTTSSYSLKNIVDKEEIYVSNGAFIKALHILKLSYQRCSKNSQNVWVKFDEKDLERVIKEYKNQF